MKLRTLALAAVLAAGSAAPALAANWDRIDSVNVSHGADRDSVSPDFGGPVEALRFTARESGMQCKAITAVFGNGERSQIFSGRIARGTSRAVDLPGARRNIAKLNFRCHALDKSGGRIVIEANAGQYRSQWLKSPNWARLWAAIVDANVNYWVYLGRENFAGRDDVETTFAGWGGRSMNAVGLRPVNDDARCSHVIATFANGTSRELDVNRGDLLYEGRTYRVDLPGTERNVTRLVLKCRAEHGRSVAINIYANK